MNPISDAESQLMQVLWQQHPLSAEDIAAALAGRQDWTLGTVKTLLNRLLNKGAVSAEKDGRRYLYAPLIAKADWEQGESMGLLDRLFDGQLAPLVAHFSSRRRLSAADRDALRKLLEQDDER